MNDNSAKIYSFLMTVFVVMLVLTNIIGTKIFVCKATSKGLSKCATNETP